ncbi:MAG: response regulator, partial [Planctomycetota bacterium]|nr:response regulator [Planctomycetota bacterium]
AAAEAPIESIRVDVGEMDKLLEGIAELGARLASVRRVAEGATKARLHGDVLAAQATRLAASGGRDRAGLGGLALGAEDLRAALEKLQKSLGEDIGQAELELAQVRDAANQLRLLPAQVVFASVERAVRDAAETLHKPVRFEAGGGETRLDAHVLAAIRDALLHLVRNAVAHGIESEGGRAAAGKPAAGLVRLDVERVGSHVRFVCKDDGGGLNLHAVRQAALRRGLLAPADAERMGAQDLIQIVLQGGVSTAGAVDQVSGRGIGLDVVRSTARRLKGDVLLRTEEGKGTEVEVVVPVSLAAVAALRVQSAGVVASIPLAAVKEVVRLEESDLARTSDGAALQREGEAIPFLPMSQLLGHEEPADAPARRSAVVLNASTGLGALGVERLLGTASVVVRSLPAYVRAEAFVAGAASDLAGSPELMFDPANLVSAIRARRSLAPPAARPQRPPILVIDDSLTTRMLEQSILESAGYEVALATSAEEGLEKVRAGRFGLIVVDVEMPGMNGFEFVEQVRADAALSGIPCILVTSRGSPEDKIRGKKAGARAYIVKGEFDQGLLLQTIRQLMG